MKPVCTRALMEEQVGEGPEQCTGSMKSLRELHTYQRQNRCSVVTSLRAFESKFLPTRLDGLHGFLVPLRPSFHLAPQFAPVFFCS